MPFFNNLNAPLNIIFMGTPEIASESLRNILGLFKANILDLKCIYTKPPVWNSKKRKIIKSSVNMIADEMGIKVRMPKSLKNNSGETEFLKSLDLDLIVVVAFGLILPDNILAIPKYGVINLHPSLLPDLRGPSPVHYAILKRLRHSGVSIMALDNGIDTGPIIAQNKVIISKDEYYETLYENLSKAGGILLAEVIKTVFKVRSNVFGYAYPQSLIQTDNIDITETKPVNSDTRRVDFFRDEPLEIYSKIRAFRESGGAFFIFKNKTIKLVEARLLINRKEFEIKQFERTTGCYDYDDYAASASEEIFKHIKNFPEFAPAFSPGVVILANMSGFVVKTAKKGVYLSLLKLKSEGKRLMEYVDFINGYRIKSGDALK